MYDWVDLIDDVDFVRDRKVYQVWMGVNVWL